MPASTGVGAPDVWGSRHDNAAADALRPPPPVIGGPSFLDSTGLPFVFDSQLLEGTVPVQDVDFSGGAPLTVDRTGAGAVRGGQMPARNGVFGYNLSR